jgi:hypothetical protein
VIVSSVTATWPIRASTLTAVLMPCRDDDLFSTSWPMISSFGCDAKSG